MSRSKNLQNKSNKGGSHGKPAGRRNNQGRQRDQESHATCNAMETGQRPGGNDVSWHSSKDPALMRDAASIPFSWSTGVPISLEQGTFNFKGWTDQVVPGILTQEVIPTCGLAQTPNSPINIAATSYYSYVRHANSGHTNYDAPDLMLMTFAMSQVYAAINHLMRIYGSMFLFSGQNRYLPRAMVTALGGNYDDISTHLADFRYGINALIHKAASLTVPGDMGLFRWHAFLFQNIYTEGPSPKDQLYAYVPGGFYYYQLNTDSSGMLKFQVYGDNYTASQLLEIVNGMLDPLVTSEDINIMSGDILKAYGDNIIKLQTLPDVYPIVPVYDLVVLEQFKNATPIGAVDNLDIVQDSKTHGYLLCIPKLHAKAPEENAPWQMSAASRLNPMYQAKKIVTLETDASPELVLEVTRLTVCGLRGTTDADQIICSGTAVPVRCRVWQYKYSSEKGLEIFGYPIETWQIAPSNTGTSVATWTSLCACLSDFKYHPCVFMVITQPSTDGVTPSATGDSSYIILGGMFYDVDNYAVLTAGELERLHEAATLNELAVPSIGKFFG